MEDSFNWLMPIINGCTSEFHLDCCRILLNLFEQKYKDEPQFKQAMDELIKAFIEKETSIIVYV